MGIKNYLEHYSNFVLQVSFLSKIYEGNKNWNDQQAYD